MSSENETFSRRIKRLKNGSDYPHGELMRVIHFVNQVSKTHPDEFFELVKLCRFPDHTAPQHCVEFFEGYEVFYKKEVKDIIRDVILSAVSGRTLSDLEIKSPLEDGVPARLLMV